MVHQNVKISRASEQSKAKMQVSKKEMHAFASNKYKLLTDCIKFKISNNIIDSEFVTCL